MKRILLLLAMVLGGATTYAQTSVFNTIRVDSVKNKTADTTGLIHIFNPLRMRYNASNYADFTVSSGGNLTIAPTANLVLSPGSNVTINSLTADRLVVSDASKNLVSTISADNLRSSVTGTTGTVSLVFSANSALTGTTTAESLTFTGTLTASGTAANYALGANFISRAGTDAGFSLDASNNATLSGDLTVSDGNLVLTTSSGGSFLDVNAPTGQNTNIRFRENSTSRWGLIYNASSGLFSLFNNTTSLNALEIANATSNVTVLTDLAVNGGDLTTSATTFNLLNATVQTLNLGGASTATTISATTGLTTIRNNTFIGDQKNFGSTSFVSGFTGAGYQSFYKDAEYWFETDNVNIRGTLSAYELLIQQIRATNGSVYISSAQKVDTVITATVAAEVVIMEDPNDDNVAYFVAGDIVLMQRVQIDDPTQLIKRIVRLVDSVASDTVWFDTTGIGKPADVGIIAAGDEYVRIGNTTDTDRQGSVYLTADDVQAPYIDIIDGVASWTDFRSVAKLKSRMGRLTGITDADFGGALTGYGAYVEQGYFKGNIHVKSGVSQALINSAIQIGNITGTANSAIKISNTGTASTSGFFAYDASGAQLFKLALDATAQISSAHFSPTDIWAGNAALNNAATELVFGDLGSAEPKFALGASADAISLTAGTGVFANGSGHFKAGTGDLDATPTGTGVSWDGTTLRVASNGVVSLSANATNTTVAGWVATAGSFTSGNIALQAGGADNVLVSVGNLRAAFGQTLDELGGETGNYGISLVDIVAEVEYFRFDDAVKRISGFTIGDGLISATNLSFVSGAANTARVEVGAGDSTAGLNSPNSPTDVAFWAGATHANRATAPLRVYADGFIFSENSPYDLANTAELYEEFTDNLIIAGDPLFNLGWFDSGLLSISVGVAESGRPGIIGIRENTSAGDYLYGPYILLQDVATHWFSIETGTVTSNWHGKIGLEKIGATTDGIFFRRNGNQNWHTVTRSSSTETTTDTGVAASASFKQFKIIVRSGAVDFYIDETLEATHTTNIPTGTGRPFFYIASIDNSTQELMNIDYFQMRITGLNR